MTSTGERRAPWRVADNPFYGCCFSVGIEDANGGAVADVTFREDGPLIAAAPDLLAFARSVAEYDEYRDDHEDPLAILARIEAAARAVVAKAEGRPAEGREGVAR